MRPIRQSSNLGLSTKSKKKEFSRILCLLFYVYLSCFRFENENALVEQLNCADDTTIDMLKGAVKRNCRRQGSMERGKGGTAGGVEKLLLS